jgi:hypothetical protein
MHDLMTLVPIFAFMLIPLWIPLAAMAFGALHDAVVAPARVAGVSRSARRTTQAVSPVGPRVRSAGTAR